MIWLDALEAHVEAERWAEALQVSVEEWRACRDPALGDLIDSLSTRVPRSPAYAHEAWLDRALVYDPVVVPRLALMISVNGPDHGYKAPPEARARRPAIERVFGDAWVDAWTRRVVYACHWPPDPRVTWIVLDWIERWDYTFPRNEYGGPHAWGEALQQGVAFIANVMRDLADVRARARLEALRDRPPGRSNGVRAAQRMIAAGGLAGLEEPWDQPLRPEQRVRLEVMLDELGRVDRVVPPEPQQFLPDGLWLDIRDAPDDDGPRQVLADALLERGDPRGELLARQLQAHRRQGPNEIGKLLRRHWTTWLGEDTGKLLLRRRCEISRGMLETIVVGPGSYPSWRYDAAIGHRELVAVRTVRPHAANPPDYARLVASLPNVRTIGLDSVAQARALAELGPYPGVTGLELFVRDFGANLADQLQPLAQAVPALAQLQVYRPPAPEELERIRATWPRLERLVIELAFSNQPLEPSTIADVPGLTVEWRRRSR